MPRLHCPALLESGAEIALPPAAARHAQVLRMQPGDALTLFGAEGSLGGEWQATVTHMGRAEVRVRVGAHAAVEREAARTVRLAVGMPANERMDWLVEKAAELGAAGLQPLTTERAVLRLTGERATKKQAHWQAVAIAACEQCGRNRVPPLAAPLPLAGWLHTLAPAAEGETRLLLSLRPNATPLIDAARGQRGPVWLLSGPEGGLAPQEEEAALAAGFAPTRLGAPTLRAETAPLAALAVLTLA